MATKKTAKQKEFELLMNGTADNIYELTSKLKATDIELIRRFKDKISWSQIACRNTLTDEFIDEFYEYLQPNLGKMNVNVNVNREFLRFNRNYINWNDFVWRSNGNRFTLDFIEEFKTEISPYISKLVTKKGLPEESRQYLIKNDNDNFIRMSDNPSISMKLLKQFQNELDWEIVSARAMCLNKPKNFEFFKDRINIRRYTSTDELSWGDRSNRIKRIITKEFLEEYLDGDINWEHFFSIGNWNVARSLERGEYKNDFGTVDLNFFKDRYNTLPTEIKDAYNKHRINYKIVKAANTYYVNLIPWN